MLSSEAAPDAVTLCPGNKTFFTISQSGGLGGLLHCPPV